MKQKTFYITTPIYYASGNLHIGHAYTTTICDTIAGYKKMRGYDVYYLTGTDEHGEKVQKKAAAAGLTPQAFVDDLVVNIKNLWQVLRIQNNDFIRTTEARHQATVSAIFSQLLAQGDIYKGEYEGWYCTPCEAFWTESQLHEGHLCPDCGRPVYRATEETYFFRMSKYADQLIRYYNDHPGFIEPESRKNEMMNNFLLPGLEDLSVSRTSFDWGIPVQEDPKHVVYVWIDALSNYISALGYKNDSSNLFDRFWHNDDDHEILHVVGKEIVRFHVIYWPIMLLALGLPLPTKIFAHGWIVMKDGKMSKSVGNVVYPEMLIARYGLDALRYFVTTCIPFGQDGLFTPELFLENVNTDLVNNYGNLVSRTAAMIQKYTQGVVPTYAGVKTPFDADLEAAMLQAKVQYEHAMDAFHIDQGARAAFELLSKANKYIDDTQPWALAKDPNQTAALQSVLTHLALVIKAGTILLSPFLIDAPQRVYASYGITDAHYDHAFDWHGMDGAIVTKAAALFPRLDLTLESEYIRRQMGGQ